MGDADSDGGAKSRTAGYELALPAGAGVGSSGRSRVLGSRDFALFYRCNTLRGFALLWGTAGSGVQGGLVRRGPCPCPSNMPQQHADSGLTSSCSAMQAAAQAGGRPPERGRQRRARPLPGPQHRYAHANGTHSILIPLIAPWCILVVQHPWPGVKDSRLSTFIEHVLLQAAKVSATRHAQVAAPFRKC